MIDWFLGARYGSPVRKLTMEDLKSNNTLLNYIDWLYSISDPRVIQWPFMSSHWPVIAVILAYLGMVRWGPTLMTKRKPLDLKPLMIAYNLGISLVNLYICRETYSAATRLGYSYVCQKVVYSSHPEELRMAAAIWWFFLSKIIELLDTVFLIVRKKNNQLSFLHVYHHATMVIFWWIGAKWVAGGTAFFPAMTNSAVHVLMYSYYGLAALGPKVQKYLWWKPYLTQIQMLQFVAGLYFGIQSFYVTCEFPLWMKYTFIAYMASLLILFGNFYIKRYISSERGDKKQL